MSNIPRASVTVAGVDEVEAGLHVGHLAAGAGSHSNDQRHVELTAGHVPERCRVVENLIECQQAEIHRHHFHNRTHAAQGRADAGADEGAFRQRRITNAFRAELVEQPLAAGIGAAVFADILPHEKDARVALERVP